MTRVMAAMSGGVDSSVAVHLLANRDDVELEGAYIRTWQHEENFLEIAQQVRRLRMLVESQIQLACHSGWLTWSITIERRWWTIW